MSVVNENEEDLPEWKRSSNILLSEGNYFNASCSFCV